MEYIIGAFLACSTALFTWFAFWLEIVSRRMHEEEKVYRKATSDSYVNEGKDKGWIYRRLFIKSVNRGM